MCKVLGGKQTLWNNLTTVKSWKSIAIKNSCHSNISVLIHSEIYTFLLELFPVKNEKKNSNKAVYFFLSTRTVNFASAVGFHLDPVRRGLLYTQKEKSVRGQQIGAEKHLLPKSDLSRKNSRLIPRHSSLCHGPPAAKLTLPKLCISDFFFLPHFPSLWMSSAQLLTHWYISWVAGRNYTVPRAE